MSIKNNNKTDIGDGFLSSLSSSNASKNNEEMNNGNTISSAILQSNNFKSSGSNAKNIITPVSIIMGSKSDYETMKNCEDVLKILNIKFETLIVSAHRTPQRMFDFAKNAKSRNIKVIIAAAGGAAHLPGMVASLTELPVIGVPIKSSVLFGIDSLLSIVQMPFGVPVATVAIGEAGAKNAAILAAKMLALNNEQIAINLADFISKQTKSVDISPNGHQGGYDGM